jgi:hypothetical protein
MQKKFKFGEILEIIWEDTLLTSGWHWLSDINYKEKVLPQLVHKSIGYFIRSDEKIISIAQSIRIEKADNDHSIGDIIHIPKKVIISLRRIK